MKRWSFSVRQKLTVVVALCVVLPLLALTVWQAYVWKGEQIAARQAVLERETEALWSEAERAVELCRVSAQAVSTNTRLTDYLSALIWGKSVSNLDIYEFYNNDVASLERLVASNPDLYPLPTTRWRCCRSSSPAAVWRKSAGAASCPAPSNGGSTIPTAFSPPM